MLTDQHKDKWHQRGREKKHSPHARAIGRLHPNAAAVPRRAIATCKPMAKATSCPVNHLIITLETVIPVISAPIPKMANPKLATITCIW